MSLVFISTGGATYTEFWVEVLSTDPEGFGRKCAAIANKYGVGFEIDYEASSDPPLEALEKFIVAYRTYDPATAYDPGSTPLPQSFLTIDLGQGAQFMGAMANWVAQTAEADWAWARLFLEQRDEATQHRPRTGTRCTPHLGPRSKPGRRAQRRSALWGGSPLLAPLVAPQHTQCGPADQESDPPQAALDRL